MPRIKYRPSGTVLHPDGENIRSIVFVRTRFEFGSMAFRIPCGWCRNTIITWPSVEITWIGVFKSGWRFMRAKNLIESFNRLLDHKRVYYQGFIAISNLLDFKSRYPIFRFR